MGRNEKKFIGVFDSGFGGLNTLKSIIKKLPGYNYIYLGDSARAPYGSRPPNEVYKFTKQAVDFLFKHNCELVVLACNTASSEALRKIQQEYLPKNYAGKKVLGVLIPAAEFAVLPNKTKRVGVMATEGTVRAESFQRELGKLDHKIEVFQQACPLLVPLIEEGNLNEQETQKILQHYLEPLLQKNIDTLILGCTHYGILHDKIKKIIGTKIRIVDETKIVPQKLKDYLKRHPKLEKQLGRDKIALFYSTDPTANFQKLGSKFFGAKINAKKARL